MNEQSYYTEYQKGFNEGYLITKHLPELSNSLAQIKNETPRIEGFKAGRTEYMQEKIKTLLPESLFNISRKPDSKNKDSREIDFEKD